MKNDDIYWVWYSAVKGITNSVKLKLLEEISSPKELFRTRGMCLKEFNVSESIISKIKEYSTVEFIEKLADKFQNKDDIGVVTYFDFDYPKMLCNINNPPIVLYYKGNIEILNKKCIAIVGTRDATENGLYNARSFARELAGQGYTIVSGMAKGIDSSAHIGAMGVGNTAAVLGCGVDVVYPKENMELYSKLCRDGVVISEFLPGTEPFKSNFLIRNRLISGLSDGVVMIEAPAKSGAMNTISHAIEQGRDTFVFFDDSARKEYAGNRELIDEGATAVTSPYDVISQSGFTAFDSVKSVIRVAEETHDIMEAEVKEEKDYSSLNGDEMKIINLIKSGTNQFDEIVLNSEMDISSVGYILTMLEFKGFLIQKAGKVYEEA